MKILQAIVLLAIAGKIASSPQPDNIISDAIDGIETTGSNVLRDLTELGLTVEDLLDIGFRYLLGLPFEIALNLLADLCEVLLALNILIPGDSPNVDDINFVLITKENRTYFPLSDPVSTWKGLINDNETEFILFVTGYLTQANSSSNDAAKKMAEAYLCRGNVHFVLLDVGEYLTTLYTWAAFNTKKIGELVGQALASLINYINLENIHLIGHSLGAQICGAAGRSFTEQTNKYIPRITGLDPAQPCFKTNTALMNLQKGDAAYIDIIHTDPNILGQGKPSGNSDFWPGAGLSIQPGCTTITCSHSRSWKYYAESVYPGHAYDFLSVRCGSTTDFLSHDCRPPWIPMGYATNSSVMGSLYLNVNSHSPYGQNATGPVVCITPN